MTPSNSTPSPNPPTNNFTGKRFPNNVPNIGGTSSVSFWFRNSLPNSKRPVTAYLFARGIDGLKSADGDHPGIGGNQERWLFGKSWKVPRLG
ncbi:hypothetical protein GYB43_16250 [bacterium]|jgi:hypothetical protein|nr:hypothetical protein [bacterium]